VRELFEEISDERRLGPVEAARRAVKPQLPRRFYQSASIAETEEGFRILLDGRPVRTPAGRFVAVPARPIAHALTAEWDAQHEHINPVSMPVTRLVNSVIDGVADQAAAVGAEVEQYLASDLLFYRAEAAGLAEREAVLWDPILAWVREAFSARFLLATGVVFTAQPQSGLANVAAAIPRDPWRLGAVHSMTTLTGSALLALAVLGGRLTAEEAWSAAHVDEDWNFEQWGRETLALERRAFRFAEMNAAATLIAGLAS
jgi:chaperone required for assembly of F1-ATPase